MKEAVVHLDGVNVGRTLCGTKLYNCISNYVGDATCPKCIARALKMFAKKAKK